MARRKGAKRTVSSRPTTTGTANTADVTCHLSTTRKQQGPNGVTSSFIGVTQYRRTGKWEAHLWLKSKVGSAGDVRRSGGRQVHLGTYMHAADAAVAYDRAARRFREPGCALNFKHELYEDDWFLRTHGHLDEDAFVLQLREFAYALLNWHKTLEEQQQPVLPALHHRAVTYNIVEPTPTPRDGTHLRPHQLRQLAAIQRQGPMLEPHMGPVLGEKRRSAALAAAVVAAKDDNDDSSSDDDQSCDDGSSDQDYSPRMRAPHRRAPPPNKHLDKAAVGSKRPCTSSRVTDASGNCGALGWGPLPPAVLPHAAPVHPMHTIPAWRLHHTTPNTPMRSPSPRPVGSGCPPSVDMQAHEATPAPMTHNASGSQVAAGRSPTADNTPPGEVPIHDSAADTLLIHFKSPNLSQEPPGVGPLVPPTLLIASPCPPTREPPGHPFDFVVSGSPMISPGTLLTPSIFSPAAQVQGHSLYAPEGGEEHDVFASLQASCMSLQF